MKETMSWRFIKLSGNVEAEFMCSWCHSVITLNLDDELPYCKHCGREPEDDNHTVAVYLKLQMYEAYRGFCDKPICKQAMDLIAPLVIKNRDAVIETNRLKDNLKEAHLDIQEKQEEIGRLERTQIQYVEAWIDEFVARLKEDVLLATPDIGLMNNVIDELVESMKSDFSRIADFNYLIQIKAIKEFAKMLKEADGHDNHTFDDCASILVSEEYVKGREEKIREIWDTIDRLVKEKENNGGKHNVR